MVSPTVQGLFLPDQLSPLRSPWIQPHGVDDLKTITGIDEVGFAWWSCRHARMSDAPPSKKLLVPQLRPVSAESADGQIRFNGLQCTVSSWREYHSIRRVGEAIGLCGSVLRGEATTGENDHEKWRVSLFGRGARLCVLTEMVTEYYSWVRITRSYQFLLSTDFVQLCFDPKAAGVSWNQPWTLPLARTVLNSFWYGQDTRPNREYRYDVSEGLGGYFLGASRLGLAPIRRARP